MNTPFPRRALAGFVSAVAVLAWTPAVAGSLGLAPRLPVLLALAVVAAGLGATLFARRLPASIDAALAGRRKLAVAWVLLALVAVVQVGRLAEYMVDKESDWFLTTREPFFAKHECLNAYVYGAELDRRGEENVYDPAHYPGLTRDAEPQTEIAGMAPEDPYQYPPPFLLLPRAAIELTNDYQTIRVFWFALNVTLCLGAVLALSLWVGGRAGAAAALLSPFVVAAFPVLHDFQYGQFHFAAIALAVLGMLAFAARRTVLGGTLLAAAILAKMFPVFLLVPLAAQRRWRELGATAAAGIAFVLLSLGVSGPAPFAAFADHLPRLGDGQAFAFEKAWPEVASLVVAGNQGVQGVVHKLEAMGISGMGDATAKTATDVFLLGLVALGFLVGVRTVGASRARLAAGWLGLLGLASLGSAGAWTDYVPLTAVWALTLLAPVVAARSRGVALKIALGLAAAMSFTLFGTVPIGDFAAASWMLPLSLLAAVLLFVTFGSAAGVAIGELAPAAALRRFALRRPDRQVS